MLVLTWPILIAVLIVAYVMAKWYTIRLCCAYASVENECGIFILILPFCLTHLYRLLTKLRKIGHPVGQPELGVKIPAKQWHIEQRLICGAYRKSRTDVWLAQRSNLQQSLLPNLGNYLAIQQPMFHNFGLFLVLDWQQFTDKKHVEILFLKRKRSFLHRLVKVCRRKVTRQRKMIMTHFAACVEMVVTSFCATRVLLFTISAV